MKKKYTYRLNPHTLSYEKVEATWGDRLKKVSTTALLGIVLGVFFSVAAVHFFDSPKERLLKEEIAEYRQQLAVLNKNVERCNKVLADIEERDSAVYRTIFGASPVSEAQRRPTPKDYSGLSSSGQLIKTTSLRVDTLESRLYAQSLSLDEIYKMAGSKQQRMATMPAIMPIKKNQCRLVSGFGMRYHPILHYRRMHTGVDLTAQSGTPVYATGDGSDIVGVHRGGTCFPVFPGTGNGRGSLRGTA